MIDTVTYSGFVLSSRKITTRGTRTGVPSEHLRLQQFLRDSHLAEEAAVNEAVLCRVHMHQKLPLMQTFISYQIEVLEKLHPLFIYWERKKMDFSS